jgi:hypothetical protein
MKENWLVNCGSCLGATLFNLFIGGWAVNYLLVVLAGEKIPFYGAALLGLFTGPVSVTAALVVAILRQFGVL